jgi:COMPASS component SWD1
VWDVETRGIARVLEGHVRAVSSIRCVAESNPTDTSWSRNNRYLVSSSLDSTAIIWDLSVLPTPSLLPQTPVAGPSTSRVETIRFDAPVASAVFHPRNSKIILASLTCNDVVLVDLRSKTKNRLEDVMEGDESVPK